MHIYSWYQQLQQIFALIKIIQHQENSHHALWVESYFSCLVSLFMLVHHFLNPDSKSSQICSATVLNSSTPPHMILTSLTCTFSFSNSSLKGNNQKKNEKYFLKHNFLQLRNTSSHQTAELLYNEGRVFLTDIDHKKAHRYLNQEDLNQFASTANTSTSKYFLSYPGNLDWYAMLSCSRQGLLYNLSC